MTNNEPAEDVEPVEPELDPLAPDADAPYGYMIDADTGERRAKKRPGRQRVVKDTGGPAPGGPVLLDELRARGPIQREEDRSPDKPPRSRGKRGRAREPKDTTPLPPFRAGPIAAGVNKLYARAGKLLRVMDGDIGSAVIAVTRKESDDDVTVGEAWEEIAKVNPNIRRFLLRVIQGGAWSSLFMAHAPILLAVLMKDAIRKHIPFMKLISALLENEDDGTPSDVSEQLGGIGPADVQQMMAAAMSMMNGMGAAMPRSAGAAGAGPRLADPPAWGPPDIERPPWSDDLPDTA